MIPPNRKALVMPTDDGADLEALASAFPDGYQDLQNAMMRADIKRGKSSADFPERALTKDSTIK